MDDREKNCIVFKYKTLTCPRVLCITGPPGPVGPPGEDGDKGDIVNNVL